MTDFIVTPEGECQPTITFVQKEGFPEMFGLLPFGKAKALQSIMTRVLRKIHAQREVMDGEPTTGKIQADPGGASVHALTFRDKPIKIGRPLEEPTQDTIRAVGYNSPDVELLKRKAIWQEVKEDDGDYDIINKPSHYTSGKVETWDLIELALTDEEFRGGLKFAILKYVLRYAFKNGVEDLEKSKKFIDRLIRFERGERVVHMKGNKAECGNTMNKTIAERHRARRDTRGI